MIVEQFGERTFQRTSFHQCLCLDRAAKSLSERAFDPQRERAESLLNESSLPAGCLPFVWPWHAAPTDSAPTLDLVIKELLWGALAAGRHANEATLRPPSTNAQNPLGGTL